MSELPDPNQVSDVHDFFAHEEFLAFFDFHLPKPGGRLLEGLCKVARPQAGHRERVDYLCLTFIVDTPSRKEEEQIEALLAKLNEAAFKPRLPQLQTLTSVPTSDRRAENYIHQLDLIFRPGGLVDVREVIPVIMFTLRETTGLKTESPQWWDDDAVKPQPTAAEKANWGKRFKAIWQVMSS